MIILQVNKINIPWYVPLNDIQQMLRNSKMPLSAKEFSKMIVGSSVHVYEREPQKIGVYPHDVAKIFYILNIPVTFVDENEEELRINKNLSGIRD